MARLMRGVTISRNFNMPNQPQRGKNSAARDVTYDIVMLDQTLRINGDNKSCHECGDGGAS